MRTTVKLVIQSFRTYGRTNNITYVKHFTTFKNIAINFMEETLKNNAFAKKTQLDVLKSALNNSTSLTDEKYNISLTDSEKMKKRKVLNALTDSIHTQHVYAWLDTINKIDAQYCNCLDIMSYNEIFKSLLFFAKTVPTKVTRMNFYNKVIELLHEGISNKVFNNSEIVLCLYLVGLQKKNGVKDIRNILKYLEFDKLLLHEICIVAETTFKSGLKLSQIQIKYIETLIENEAKILVADTHLLVPLCKVLRLAGPSKTFLPNNLNREVVKKKDQYLMIPAIHILKIYAEIYLAEPMVLQRLITDIIARMSSANQRYKRQGFYKSQIYEPKYLDGFLWSICILNYKLMDVQLLEIRTFIDSMQSSLFNNPKRLLRILLSLQILGCQTEFMIQECITRNMFWDVCNDKFWKSKTSLHLLLRVIQIESPNIQLPTKLFPEVYVALNIPKSVKFVATIVSGLSRKMKLQNVTIDSPVEGLYIAGVSFDHPILRSFHIDVLNDITCLRFQRIPHGLLNLKLRLLQQLGYRSILINEDDVKDRIVGIAYIEKCLNDIVYAK